ncbi:4Fe-4S binding protein, partial [Dysosmobacter sp.]
MVRRVIEIDREKCNGCGACADACQEGFPCGCVFRIILTD